MNRTVVAIQPEPVLQIEMDASADKVAATTTSLCLRTTTRSPLRFNPSQIHVFLSFKVSRSKPIWISYILPDVSRSQDDCSPPTGHR